MFIVALFNSQSVSENGLMNKEGMVCFLYTHTHKEQFNAVIIKGKSYHLQQHGWSLRVLS